MKLLSLPPPVRGLRGCEMHEDYIGHKIVAFGSSAGAAALAWLPLADWLLIFQTLGAGLGCLIAVVTLGDMVRRRWGKKPGSE
jgi:hypothetical protein